MNNDVRPWPGCFTCIHVKGGTVAQNAIIYGTYQTFLFYYYTNTIIYRSVMPIPVLTCQDLPKIG